MTINAHIFTSLQVGIESIMGNCYSADHSAEISMESFTFHLFLYPSMTFFSLLLNL